MCPESASLSTWRGLATSGLAWQALQHGLVRLGSAFRVLSKTHLPPGMGGELVPTPDPRSWKLSGFRCPSFLLWKSWASLEHQFKEGVKQ